MLTAAHCLGSGRWRSSLLPYELPTVEQVLAQFPVPHGGLLGGVAGGGGGGGAILLCLEMQTMLHKCACCSSCCTGTCLLTRCHRHRQQGGLWEVLKQSLIGGDFNGQDSHLPQQAEATAVPACRQPAESGTAPCACVLCAEADFAGRRFSNCAMLGANTQAPQLACRILKMLLMVLWLGDVAETAGRGTPPQAVQCLVLMAEANALPAGNLQNLETLCMASWLCAEAEPGGRNTLTGCAMLGPGG